MLAIRRRYSVVGLIVVVLVATALPAFASAPATVTFGIEPAAGRGDTRSALTYGLAPGASATDRVAVVNYSNRALQVRVYGVDATGSGATFALAAASATPSGVGAWLWFGDKHSVELTVPARTVHAGGTQTPGRAEVPVRIDVDSHALSGAHSGGVVVSLGGATDDRTPGVTLEQRVALRVYVTVASSASPDSSSADDSPRPTAGAHSARAAALIWALVLGALALLVVTVVWWYRRPALSRRNDS